MQRSPIRLVKVSATLALTVGMLWGCAASQVGAPLPTLDRATNPAPSAAAQKAAIDSVLNKGAAHKSEALKKIEAAK
jgi:hypothetical protein